MSTQNLTDDDTEQNSVQDDQIAHIAGVFDAVGTISLRVVKDNDYRLNYTLQPIVQVIRPNEDDPIMGKLMAYCDEQGVRYGISEKSHGPDRDRNSIMLTVKEPESVQRFLEPLMDYLVTKYFEAEVMVGEIVPAIKDGKHLEKQGFYDLMALVEELRSQSADLRKSTKYTQEFFAEEWSGQITT